MQTPGLKRSRLVVGIVLVIIAVLMFLFGSGNYSTAGAIAVGMIGLVSIAISRRRVTAYPGRPTRARCALKAVVR